MTCGVWVQRRVRQDCDDCCCDVAVRRDRLTFVDALGAPTTLKPIDVRRAQLDDRAVGPEDVVADQEREGELTDDDESVCDFDVGDGDSCDDVAQHVER